MHRLDTEDLVDVPQRRKVLILIKCMGYGGAERLVVSMMRHRDQSRFDYEVAYVLESRDTLVGELRATGVPVHSLGARGNADLRWTGRLRTLLRTGNFDIVHSHLPLAASLGRLVAHTLPGARRPALVYTEHSVWDKMAVAVKVLNRATIALDDRLIVVSEACRRSLPRSLQARATVVVHGIELEPIRAAVARRAELRAAVRAELGCSDDALLAVTVAGLRWPKGHDVLLEAARHVLDAGCAVHFVAVGDGARRGDLEAQRRRLGLDGSVVFVGERPDVARFLAAADLYVLPSRQEGLPLALMEALSSGLPVVATAVSEIPTLLTDGVDALVVPPESARALADAVVELARDESLRARLGARALGLADRFDVGRCVAEVESIYDEVCPLPVRQGS